MSIEKILPDDPIARSADVQAGNLDRLKALFPELVTESAIDGKPGTAIDVGVLKQLVGDATVSDADEKYGLNWHGKRQARQLALTPSTGTLRPCPQDSVDWDSTQNLMIEGDNLEVLKLLQKSYAGKVKLIYIDPPYNTGKDFVYPDNFRDGIGNYLELTGQVEGRRKLSSNTEASGRFHTDWLNMMYPRLKLARNLLRKDGVIFVSIDQGEIANLRQMLDEVFGEENFVNIFSWVRTRTPAALSQKTKNVIEYVVCYERSRTGQPLLGIEKPAQSANTLLNQPNAVSVLEFSAGTETGIANGVINPGTYGSATYPVELLDEVEVRDGRFARSFRLRARFRWSQQYLEQQIELGTKVRIATDKFLPSYEKDSYGREALPNLIDESVGVGTNESAGTELESLMGERIFDYPKPLSLLRYLINSCTSGEDIVLDFFAGSGTTGHAVMAQNAQDSGQRRFILVQLPEPIAADAQAAKYCDRIGRPRTISELTKERLRRAAEALKTHGSSGADPGFRVFSLDASNIREWDPRHREIEQTLLDHVHHFVAGRSELDIVFETLLKFGLPLATAIDQRPAGKATIYGIGVGSLMVCLPEMIEQSDIEQIARVMIDWRVALSPEVTTTAVFRDAAFADDVSKSNMAAILAQAHFHVRSI